MSRGGFVDADYVNETVSAAKNQILAGVALQMIIFATSQECRLIDILI